MCAMGGKRRAARVLVAVLCSLLGSAAGRPAAAGSTVTLTLTPTQGPASSAFTMTFTDPVLLVCPGGTVTFSWDGTSRTLATAPLNGPGCTATASAVPPAGANAVGTHTVIARLSPSLTDSRSYTILAAPAPTPTPRPSATPTRRPSPTPSPSASPAATPTPEPEPSATPAPAPCGTNVPQATGAVGYLEVGGVAGDAVEPQHAGATVISSVRPPSMLPPVVGTIPLTEVELLKAVDRSSPALVEAVAGGTHFDCVRLELGPAQAYLYATYAFHDALFSTYTPAGDGRQPGERLTLSYVSVDWEYQPRDGSPVATGRGRLGETPNPQPMQRVGMARGPLILVAGLLLLGAAGGGGLLGYRWLARRRRRV
jgi:type VI protein secretion system component Hcp